MKNLKHLFTVFMLFCATTVVAEDFGVDGIYYNILSADDKTVEVTFRGDSYDDYYNEYTGSVTIPSTVTYNGTTYSVTSIGSQAFEGCSGLASIEIPNSVTSIGIRVFYNCSGLTNVVIPNSVTSIESYAFDGCSGLKTVYNFSNLTFTKGTYDYGCVAYYADKVYNAPNGFIENDCVFSDIDGKFVFVGYIGDNTNIVFRSPK